MSTKVIEAWVLHKQWSGDTSARVYFFTRDLGLINCLCKGGRIPPNQALLQAFTPLWLKLVERYNCHYAQAIESVSPRLHLVGHSLFSALYLNELLYHTLSPNYPDAALFNEYLHALHGLAVAQDRLLVERLLRRFEWSLLNSCGYGFSLTHEAGSDQLITKNAHYQFSAGEGLVASTKGIPGAHILALAQDNLNDLACLKSAKIIMRQAINHLLDGRELKARALYHYNEKNN